MVTLATACGGDGAPSAAGGCGHCSHFWGNLLIIAVVVGIGYVLSNKTEANADLLRSIYSDVKRLSRKAEEIEEKIAESAPSKDSGKKPAKGKGDKADSE